MKVQKQISLKDFTTAEGFVGRYQHLIKDVVIPYLPGFRYLFRRLPCPAR